ncbi:MAG: MerR family transcriptional regulator [Dehalococcoidia bacterium]|nr:MerR family transcriptional regulator [Dehalococcoidia bacterium]
MTSAKLFSINEFAKLTRTTNHTLRYYDNIGLLPPVTRGGNNYRYYRSGQIAIINLIRTFQTLGMTLDDITKLKIHRTPELMDELLTTQIEKVDEKIDEWVHAKKLLCTLKSSIHSALTVDEEEITVKFMPAEAIILGDVNDYSRGKNDYDALFKFYKVMGERYINLSMDYPVWGFFAGDRIKRRDWNWPDRYYFYNPEGHDRRPAALYAIGYMRGGYGKAGELYERMIDYIDKNGFEICGDAYEEYPLNEICIPNENSFLIRVMITVKQREGNAKK